ncbi:MAG: NADH-quinone oxidoreductase subunit J [Leptospiraceae bacterium]|nr:NADH-quinone oxidoreductase subunit J [Leptospiraceae bacterium]
MILDFDHPQSIFFLVFAGIVIGSSLAVVLHKNPVVSAASLVLSFFGLAGIYAVMNAIFIATMQILVYAGAIMVLVIFVIMLLSLREETHLEIWRNPLKQGGIVFLVILYGGLLISAMNYSPDIPNVKNPIASNQEKYEYQLKQGPDSPVVAKGNTATVGASTFLDFLLPFELVSVLLLAAVIGAVVIAKRDKVKETEI